MSRAWKRKEKKVASGVVRIEYAPGRVKYRVQVRRRGVSISQYFDDVGEAAKFYQETVASIRRGEEPALPSSGGLAQHPHHAATVTETVGRMMLRAARDGTFLTADGRTYSAGCVQTYEVVLRLHVVPFIGDWRIADIGTRDLQRLIDDLAAHTTQANRQKVLTVLTRVFEYAWRERLCEERNPCRDVVFRRDRSSAGIALTRRQQCDLLAAAREHDEERGYSLMYPFTRLQLGSGLRGHESRSLIYHPETGLCLESGRVTVSCCVRTTWAEQEGWKTTVRAVPGAKTKASLSTVPLGPDTVAVLAEHQRVTGAGLEDLVFPDPLTGRLLGRNRLREAWKDVKRRAGIEQLRVHDLRHTYGSSLIDAGMNVVEVSKRMRHSSPSTTLDIYAHEIREESTDDWYDKWLSTES